MTAKREDFSPAFWGLLFSFPLNRATFRFPPDHPSASSLPWKIPGMRSQKSIFLQRANIKDWGAEKIESGGEREERRFLLRETESGFPTSVPLLQKLQKVCRRNARGEKVVWQNRKCTAANFSPLVSARGVLQFRPGEELVVTFSGAGSHVAKVLGGTKCCGGLCTRRKWW